MKLHIRILSLLAGCGLSLLFIPLAEAATTTDEFFVQFVNPEWCPISSTHARKRVFNEKDSFTLTFIRDPQNNGTLTEIEARFISSSGNPNLSIEQIIMKGVGYLTNEAGTIGQFSVSGVHPDDPAFITFRGKFILNKFGAIKKISGFFVYRNQFISRGDCITKKATFQTRQPVP